MAEKIGDLFAESAAVNLVVTSTVDSEEVGAWFPTLVIPAKDAEN